MIEFDKIPDNLLGSGADSNVWLGEDGYVYKAYSKYIDLENLQKILNILNSIPEYEYEEIIGYIKSPKMIVTKQKKLKDWQDILAEYYFTRKWRLEDWEKYTEEYMKSIGFIKEETCWKRGDIYIRDIYFDNMGMDENGNMRIIDAKVLNV